MQDFQFFFFIFLIPLVRTACTGSTPYSYGAGCFAQCPWNNTVVTYLSGTSCVTSCTGSYADDSTKTCVSTCPSTPIMTYKDNVYNRCVRNCSTDPAYFAYNVTSSCVQYCPSPYWAQQQDNICILTCPVGSYYQIDGSQRTCVKICYPNYYANSTLHCVTAANCPATPVPYFGDDSTGLCVTKCPVNMGTFAQNTTRRCVLICPLGTFADPVSQRCVASCVITPLYFGSNVSRTCLITCNQGQFADNSTQQCVLTCPTNSYGDKSTRICVAICPLTQSTFADSTTNLCVPICPAGYYADNRTRSCVTPVNCFNQTVGDPVTQKCVPPSNCTTGFFADTSTGLCVVRCTTWGNSITRMCQTSCPWNPPLYLYYKDPSTNRCVLTCPSSPRLYGDNSTRTCVSPCPANSFGNPASSFCQNTCPTSYYANSLSRQCVKNCTQNSTNILYFFYQNLSCLASCPLYFYADNATLTCTQICSNNTFSYSVNRTCLPRCPSSYYGDSYSLSCVTVCPRQNGQFADDSTNLCVSVCPINPDLYGQDFNSTRTCSSTCALTGFFMDPLTRLCVVKCNATAGYYGQLSDKRCYPRCPSGYGNPYNSQCVSQCPLKPKPLFGDNITVACVSKCPNQTYGHPTLLVCVVATDCPSGYFGDDNTNLCVAVCSELLSLYGDPVLKKCVIMCTFGYYADQVKQQCVTDCNVSSSSFKDDSKKRCVSTCASLPDTFADSLTMKCEYNCTGGYFGYANSTSRVCVQMCPSTPKYYADLQNMVCVLKCANNTFQFVNNTFRGCLNSCPPQTFTNGASIDLYADNTTWRCVQNCPYGYYAFKHPSDTTKRLCVRICPMVGSTYYFAQDTNRTCVTSCPMMAKATYGDRITFKCVSTCSRGQYRDNSTGLCVYNCQPNFYANNVTWNCSAWCNGVYFAQNSTWRCVLYCPYNSYGYKNVCRDQCPFGTLKYNSNVSWLCVDGCPASPDYYADNTTQSCVSPWQCGTDLYADVATRTCLPALNCSDTTKADPISKRCVLQCSKNPMYYFTSITNLCGSTCSNGTFAYNETNLCLDSCPAPYFGYNLTANFYCTQYCPSSTYMWVNSSNVNERMCLTSCPSPLLKDDLTMSCVSLCPDYYYANATVGKCVLNCTPLYKDDASKSCVSTCPANRTASNTTYRCQDQCDFGEYQFNKICYSSCNSPNFADNLTRKCVTNCPFTPLGFADTANRRCVIKCLANQYAYLDNLTCVSTCPTNYYRELTLRLCLNPCLQGQFKDNDTLNCVSDCTTSSYPYSDPTSKSCVLTCPSNPDLYGHNNQCLTQCPSTHFAQNFTRTCVSVCPNISATVLNQSWADPLTRRCVRKCPSLSYSYSNSTKNLCLNTCPNGTYASILTQECVTQCPNGTYAHNTSFTCVQQCPPGQWADTLLKVCMPDCTHNSSLYADDSTYTCVVQCPQYPDLYGNNINKKCVLMCDASTYAYIPTRKCLSGCPSPYFADDSTLTCVQKCPSTPTVTYSNSFNNKCVSSCSNHTINSTLVYFYKDNTTMSCVTLCPITNSKYFGFNQTNNCLQTCPSGTYGDNDTRLCLKQCIFLAPKFTWMDRINNFCVTVCPYGYFADNKTFSCELTCTSGTFADTSTRRCVYNCPNNPTSYAIVVSGAGGICIYNCPNGTYSDQVSISCVTNCTITASAVYYKYDPTNACVKQCLYPYYAQLSTLRCINQCPVGFYGNLTTKKCQVCQVQCVTCAGYLVCTSCIQGFYLHEISCVVKCPTYPILYYAHKQSGVCFLTCPSPFFGQNSTGLCQVTCPALTYPSNTSRICTACPTGCLTCDALGCYMCASSYTFLPSALICNKNCNTTSPYYFNSTCFNTCPPGSYLSFDLVNCLACVLPCATCFGVAANCTSCSASYYYLGKCLDACPANFFVDSNLNCQACSSNPEKCTLPPLSYTLYPFTEKYQLKAYVVFNRAVNLTISQFITSVKIRYNKQALSSSQYTASVFNSTTFLVVFNNGASLNENSLSIYFTPGSITDQYGNILTTVTVQTNITTNNIVTPAIAAANDSISSGTSILTIVLLIILGLFFIKSGYPALITLQIVQMIHMFIYFNTSPLPYLQYNFLYILRYFHFTFLPQMFTGTKITTNEYSVFTNDMSFLANSPVLLMFIIGGSIYILISALSSKKLIKNKAIRKICKKIRKQRLKYCLIHDLFWSCYMYAVFISLFQIKIAGFSDNTQVLNMLLALATFILFLVFTIIIIKFGYKYRAQPDKIPKKYQFLMMQPSIFTLQMPMRYGRKLLFCIGLLFDSMQSQATFLLFVNLVFFLFYLMYRPSKSKLTNFICIGLQLGLLILISLFIGYDKLNQKNSNSQYGFSVAMIAIQTIMIFTVLIWSAYRLVLVIIQTQTWKIIIARLTKNSDPQYLRQLQRKRDLQFDFGSLQNRSQDQKTQPLDKMSVKPINNQKFNIFDQQSHYADDVYLQKPAQIQTIQKSLKNSRPASSSSSNQIIAVKSNMTGSVFEPRKSVQNFRNRNHLQVINREQQNIDQIIDIIKKQQPKKQQTKKKPDQKVILQPIQPKKQKVLWQQLDIDQQDMY